jgi:predicted esterase
MTETRIVETPVHGRTLFRAGGNDGLLVGFHGYAETADLHLAQLERIPGAGEWSIAAVQALHPFYVRSTQEVVASWMTRVDRDHAIADNIEYVRRVIASLPAARTIVFAGFSQGASMAWRAAAALGCSGIFVLGGDIPPGISSEGRLPSALIGRGLEDDWYTDEKLKNDLRFLRGRADVVTCVFEGGHEWTDAFRSAAGEFLQRVSSQ